jgi:hypothetical protein
MSLNSRYVCNLARPTLFACDDDGSFPDEDDDPSYLALLALVCDQPMVECCEPVGLITL